LSPVTEVIASRRKRIKLTAILILLLAMAFLLGFSAYLLLNSSVASPDTSGAPSYTGSIFGGTGPAAVTLPMGMDIDDSGNVYVVEPDLKRIQVFDREGVLLSRFPRASSEQQLNNPLYVSVSPNREVFVSDRGLGKLLVFSPQGEFLREFLPRGVKEMTWAPVAVAFDDESRMYVSDFSTMQLRIFDAQDNLIHSVGQAGGALGEFQFPNSISVEGDRVFVSDSNNGRIQVFNKDGEVQYEFPAGSLPRGIAADKAGRLFVVDALEHMIKVYRADDGLLLFSFGTQGQGDGQLLFPNDIALDGSESVLVTDKLNNRISIWSY